MSYSDYLSVKRKKANTKFINQSNEFRILNKQYLTIQSTPNINEDNEYIDSTNRFNIYLPKHDLAMLHTQMESSFISNTVINRPTIFPYIKQRIEPICWYCDNLPVDMNYINYEVNTYVANLCTRCNKN
jgi:hypothetical protein